MAQWVQAVGGQAAIIVSEQQKGMKWEKNFNVRREIRIIAELSKKNLSREWDG